MAENTEEIQPEDAASDRRGFFKKGAIAAATVAAVGVASTRTASAANGDNLKIGQANSGTSSTRLTGSQLWVSNGNSTAAVLGRQTKGASPIGVYGEAGSSAGATGNKIGVKGVGDTGVYGDGITGVHGNGSKYGVRATSTSGAGVLVDDGSVSMPPASGSWTAGSMVNDNGQLWYCTKSGTGTASSWVRMSSVFVPLAAPTRVYDSRNGGGPLVGGNVERVIDTTSTALVPGSASAVFGNFTVVSTGGPGYAAVFANGVAWPGHSNINFNGPGDVANAFVSATDSAGKLKARSGGNANIQVIFDIFGYYT